MGFLSVLHSDVGIRKKTNQDSVLLKEADTDYGPVMLAAVCDGMGGLAKGEVASAALVYALSAWFETVFPAILYEQRTPDGIDEAAVEASLNDVVQDVNQRIAQYAREFHSVMGTTAAVLLLSEGKWHTLNVGDSRIYRVFDGELGQLTKDQTFVQREMDLGHMTPEEAKVHPQRNVLLQCVGASEVMVPEFEHGLYRTGDVFMLCSDGFRHVITPVEFAKILVPRNMTSEKALKDAAVYCTELCKSRQEKDNISVAFVRAE